MLFTSFIHSILPYISNNWKNKYENVLIPEHLEKISKQILLYQKGELVLPKNALTQEYQPNLSENFDFFLELMHCTASPLDLAQKLEKIPIKHWLLLLGQQLTTTSISDENAIPPPAAQLIAACKVSYNSEISVALRAWEKHIGRRSPSPFWGVIKGNPSQKEILVQERVEYIIQHTTWWNVFLHPRYQLIYEAREQEGYGIRWTKNDLGFIGFLEPFI